MTRKTTILVADDDPDILFAVRAILEQAGHAVHEASTAAEAETILKDLKPDLAVIDLMMERKDSGFVLCHRIKRANRATPVIMLTAAKAATGLTFAPDERGEKSWLKADVLLDKPVRPEQLTAAVRKLLDREDFSEA